MTHPEGPLLFRLTRRMEANYGDRFRLILDYCRGYVVLIDDQLIGKYRTDEGLATCLRELLDAIPEHERRPPRYALELDLTPPPEGIWPWQTRD